jgi:hypothetical protein
LNVISPPPTADATPFISVGVGIAGVLVALGGELLRRRWQRPKLCVLPFREEKGDGVFVADVPESAWIRLGVRNDGRETARNVEVHVEDIVPAGPRPDARRVEAFQRQELGLLMGRRLKWADRDDKMIDIPPGMVRRVDIAHLSAGEPSYPIGDTVAVPIRMTLDRRDHAGHRHVVAGLAYDLQLSVSGSNSETALFEVRLEFGGIWMGAKSVDPLMDGSLRVIRVTPMSQSG